MENNVENNKIIKELIYWLAFIIYEELVLSGLIFGAFPKTALMIILLSSPFAIFLSLLTSIFKRKVNVVISYVLTIGLCFVGGAQLVYYKIYEAILSFYSIVNGGQVTEFMTTILDEMAQNWIGLVLIFLPVIVLIILHKTKVLKLEKDTKQNILIKLFSIVVVYGIGILCINTINTEGINSNKNLYYNVHVPKVTANRMGIFTTMKLDLERLIFGFEENISIEVNSLPEDAIKEETKYNITEIDFESLIANETNENIKQMHEYFANQIPSEQNEYTGMFKGKNLVVFVAEGLSNVAIREDVTPNLYKLYNEGFQFDNFYTPLFPVSTADGEYITDTSLIPKEGVWSIYRVQNHYMPYSYANVFKNLGYSTNAYHDHTATYYHRDKYIKTMGYDSYLAVGTGLEDRMNTSLWPNSDYETIEVTTQDYINNDKFLAYYMTVSGHLNYTTNGNCMAARNWEQVKNLPYSHKARAYLATQIELDKAVGKLIQDLEATGKLEDTVIVISPDHYPYGLTLSELNELSNYERDNTFEKHHTPLLIWSGSMKEPVKVEKVCSSLDVLPTVLNLFGVEYDSRLLIGNDILSNNKEQIVIFSDRSFITDKGRYSAVQDKFMPNEGVEIPEWYVEQISEIIYQKFKMSTMILDNDYYRKIFQ
jgi:lipoteichoic acid synthase